MPPSGIPRAHARFGKFIVETIDVLSTLGLQCTFVVSAPTHSPADAFSSHPISIFFCFLPVLADDSPGQTASASMQKYAGMNSKGWVPLSSWAYAK